MGFSDKNATESGQQRSYSPPRVVRIGDVNDGIGSGCQAYGSGDAQCETGQTAGIRCDYNGNTAGNACFGGQGATPGYCQANGNSPVSGCYSTGSTG